MAIMPGTRERSVPLTYVQGGVPETAHAEAHINTPAHNQSIKERTCYATANTAATPTITSTAAPTSTPTDTNTTPLLVF